MKEKDFGDKINKQKRNQTCFGDALKNCFDQLNI